jgi:hypothetical protein
MGPLPGVKYGKQPEATKTADLHGSRCREREVNDLTPAAAAAEILPDARSGGCMASVFVALSKVRTRRRRVCLLAHLFDGRARMIR